MRRSVSFERVGTEAVAFAPILDSDGDLVPGLSWGDFTYRIKKPDGSLGSYDVLRSSRRSPMMWCRADSTKGV